MRGSWGWDFGWGPSRVLPRPDSECSPVPDVTPWVETAGSGGAGGEEVAGEGEEGGGVAG